MDIRGAPRTLPEVTDLTRGFWTGGETGELRMVRCSSCRSWIHPPLPICDRCGCREVGYEATSGRGTVFTYAVNHQQWRPDLPVPYVVAIVELSDQAGLRVTTNIVGVDPDEVFIGMEVTVTFDHDRDVYIPIFEPIAPE